MTLANHQRQKLEHMLSLLEQGLHQHNLILLSRLAEDLLYDSILTSPHFILKYCFLHLDSLLDELPVEEEYYNNMLNTIKPKFVVVINKLLEENYCDLESLDDLVRAVVVYPKNHES
jgi:hypothetical protein